MESEFTCSICLDIANEAVETLCCHQLHCQDCVQKSDGAYKILACPTCRASLSVTPSKLARRIIGNMPVTCLNDKCNAIVTRSTLSEHLKNCAFTEYSCSGCTYAGSADKYLHHLITTHKNLLLENSKVIFSKNDKIDNQTDFLDRIETQLNAYGRTARLGENGKYYCRKQNVRLCRCCDGNCGPSNGCNCIACMKLDKETRKLPQGWFVNREGYACRRGTTGNFYCGRFMRHAPANICDGYCGPNDGPNCTSCRVIDMQVRNPAFESLTV